MSGELLLPGVKEIGCGYDILEGDFADPASCLSNLFDFSTVPLVEQKVGNVIYSLPSVLIYHADSRNEYSSSSGESIQDYMTSLNSKTKVEGSYNFFSGSLSVNFSEDSHTNRYYSFSRIQNNIYLYVLELPVGNLLMKYLQEDFAKALNDDNYSPTKLFDNYGTYFVNRIAIGGRAVYCSTTNKLQYDNKVSLSVAAEMSYKGLVGKLSASEEAAYSSAISSFNSCSETRVLTRGGDVAYGGANLPGNIDKWVDSVKDFPNMVDFDGQRSLLPIWDLCTSEERKAALRAAYPQWCLANMHHIDVYNGPAFLGAWVPLMKQFDDTGSGANLDLTVYKPQQQGDYFWVGQTAVQGYNKPAYELPNGLLLKEIVPGSLGKIADWSQIWNDAGSGKSDDYALWSPIPATPASHVALGHFFKKDSSGWAKPTEEETSNLRTVPRDCVGDGIWGEMVIFVCIFS